MPKSHLLAFLIKELREVLPPTVFFAISFNLLALTTQQIWIFVLFLIYTSVEELNARLGDGELIKVFFGRQPSKMKPTPPATDSSPRQAEPAG